MPQGLCTAWEQARGYYDPPLQPMWTADGRDLSPSRLVNRCCRGGHHVMLGLFDPSSVRTVKCEMMRGRVACLFDYVVYRHRHDARLTRETLYLSCDGMVYRY